MPATVAPAWVPGSLPLPQPTNDDKPTSKAIAHFTRDPLRVLDVVELLGRHPASRYLAIIRSSIGVELPLRGNFTSYYAVLSHAQSGIFPRDARSHACTLRLVTTIRQRENGKRSADADERTVIAQTSNPTANWFETRIIGSRHLNWSPKLGKRRLHGNLRPPAILQTECTMNVPWSLIGSAAGTLGILVAIASIAARLAGHFHLGGFESVTLFQAGIGLVVTGCFFRLHERNTR